MKILVTKSDIKAGKRFDATSCPVAIAIEKRFLGKSVKVGSFSIKVINEEKLLIHIFETTDEVRDFMCKFDIGDKVEPFEFRLA